jgi:hypothetical protein
MRFIEVSSQIAKFNLGMWVGALEEMGAKIRPAGSRFRQIAAVSALGGAVRWNTWAYRLSTDHLSSGCFSLGGHCYGGEISSLLAKFGIRQF